MPVRGAREAIEAGRAEDAAWLLEAIETDLTGVIVSGVNPVQTDQVAGWGVAGSGFRLIL